jgi:4-hydroxybenzoate polyprenyltransferase
MLRAYAQLLRLPNLFTAWADIILGWLAVGGAWQALPGLIVASSCLYSAGMVLNDVFDVAVDARERPHRPIPSGRVCLTSAVFLGSGLLLAGIVAAIASEQAMVRGTSWLGPISTIALVLAGAILLYDGILKNTVVGPVNMGACRLLNVMLGLCALGHWPAARLVWPAFVVGLYIVGVTWFARREAEVSRRTQLLAAAAVMALAVVLASAAPVALQQLTDVGLIAYPGILIVWGILVGIPLIRAVREPQPNRVQAAVKTLILGLIGLDSALAFALVGWPGLAILLLLPPAVVTGRWVYST